MRVLDLFTGSGSVARVAEQLGHEVFSIDVQPFPNVHLVKDILEVRREDIPFVPHFIWASPVCTTYSIAAISHHRNGTEPKTDYARLCDRLLDKTLEIMTWYPEAKFDIENPMGMMRKMPQMRFLPRAEITYCSYGDTRMKPTDIFSNHLWSIFDQDGWFPREKCFNGNINCHHEAAPRGSRTGTQGLKGSYERSRIPQELVTEILTNVSYLVKREGSYDGPIPTIDEMVGLFTR